MSQYQLAVTCPCCDETILGNIVADFTNPNGVVLLDLFACEAFVCENCGTTVITGDADCMYEVEEPEENKENEA